MKRIFSSIVMLICTSIVLLISACQKKADVENLQALDGITVPEANAWFSSDVVSKEKEMLAQPYSVLPEKSPKRLFARMGKLQSKLIWEEAQLFNRNSIQYIVVPITRNKKLVSNDYEIAKSLVFYKTNRGEMNMNVVEVMSEKGKSLNGKSGEVAAAAFYNRMATKNEAVPGVNATVFFYNSAYQSLNSYEMKNGVCKEAKTTLGIQKSIAEQTKGSPGRNVDAQVCESYCVVYSQYEDGVLIYQQTLYCYDDCYNTTGEPETLDGRSGGGQGGGTGQCNMTSGEADNLINSITVESVSDGSYTSGTEEAPDVNGKIRKPVTIHKDGARVNYGLGYSERFELFFKGILFKNNSNDEWKWEKLSYDAVSSVSGNPFPCTSSSATATISDVVISNDKLSANYTGSMTVVVNVACIGGAKIGSYMFNVYNTYYASHY